MNKSDGKKRRKLIIYAIMIALIAGVIALVIFLLTYKKETHIYESYENGAVSSLVCDTTETTDSAFFENHAENVKHEIKIVYNDDVISKMSYEFRGKYDSWKSADDDEGILHAKYNNYMGGHNLKIGMLNPVFQNVDGELQIRLYLDNYKNMNSVIGKLFYIGDGSVGVISKNKVEETKKYYENKGFSCIIGD